MKHRILVELSTDLDYIQTQFRIADNAGRWIDATIIDRNPPRWIPCSERMPEPEEIVLVLDTDSDTYLMERSRFHDHWILDGEAYRYSAFITHWMPLPAPPEVGNE